MKNLVLRTSRRAVEMFDGYGIVRIDEPTDDEFAYAKLPYEDRDYAMWLVGHIALATGGVVEIVREETEELR